MPRESRLPLIAIASIIHESNTFSSAVTELSDFLCRNICPADQALANWAEGNDELSGFIEGARKWDLELVPLLAASATPGGPVTDAALDALTGDLISRLQSSLPPDGLLLALHGAMVAESWPHADAEIVRRVRMAVGPEFPIVVTHDFHANISPEIVEMTTALVTYKQNPHLDMRARGLQAAGIMSQVVRCEVKPVQVIVKPAVIYNIVYQNTNCEPLKHIVDESIRAEENPKVLAASVAAGYQYADVPAMGPSVVVVTDNDPTLAQTEAQRLADMLWATRNDVLLDLPDCAAAVRQAQLADKFPVGLLDMGDNIGGGSAGDSTFLLGELLRQGAKGWVVVLADPQAVQQAVNVGVGKSFGTTVGGKTDKLHGHPIRLRGRVKSIQDGRFVDSAVRHGGQCFYDQGLTAVVEVQSSAPDLPNLLMLTTKRQPPFSIEQLRSCGIEPARARILVVKGCIAPRAAYEPICSRLIAVDSPGLTAVNPARFTFKHIRRPMYGIA